ncbi:hypothetical protein VTK26DRAFT_9065 [Humicola hyalothermophila]
MHLPQAQQVQSARSSISSELSTLYNEDEMPEELKNAMIPLTDLVVEPQRAADVGPPSSNDPFVAATLPMSLSRVSVKPGWSPRQNQNHDRFRENLERLRSLTVGQRPVQAQGLILVPGPAMDCAKPNSTNEKLGSCRLSITVPGSTQSHTGYPSRATEPPPSPTRQSPSTSRSPNGPVFRQLTKTSTLSTIPLLPPPAAPGLDALKAAKAKASSPTKTEPQAAAGIQTQQTPRRSPVAMLPSTERSSTPSSPNRRVGGQARFSFVLDPAPSQQEGLRTSTSSSLYTLEPPISATGTTAVSRSLFDLNRLSFNANSLLPLSTSASRIPDRNPTPASEVGLGTAAEGSSSSSPTAAAIAASSAVEVGSGDKQRGSENGSSRPAGKQEAAGNYLDLLEQRRRSMVGAKKELLHDGGLLAGSGSRSGSVGPAELKGR